MVHGRPLLGSYKCTYMKNGGYVSVCQVEVCSGLFAILLGMLECSSHRMAVFMFTSRRSPRREDCVPAITSHKLLLYELAGEPLFPISRRLKPWESLSMA